MAFIWTPRDPLDNTGVTLSIYITELQVNSNLLRVILSQSILTFIDQSVGQTITLAALEELKTVVNQLAIDFGFSGVEDPDVLGRPYVDHPIRLNNPAAGFAIINDLRRALDVLEETDLDEFATVIHNWYDNGAPTVIPLAAHKLTFDDPWTNVPDFIQTGFGTTCPQGFPTCDNTQAGFYRDNVLFATDKSIIAVSGTVANTLLEGPLGGPYFEVGTTISDVINPSEPFGIDEDNYYSFGGNVGSGGRILIAPRNGSSTKVILGDFAHDFDPGNTDLFVTSSSIILVSSGTLSGTLDYGKMNKITGAVETLVTGIGLQDLLATSGPFNNLIFAWKFGFEKSGTVFLTYGESYNDGDLTNRLHTIGSAVMSISGSGVVSISSDLDTQQFLQISRIPSDPIFFRWAHGFGGQQALTGIDSGNNSGVHIRKRTGGSVIKVGSPAPTNNGEDFTFAGTILATTDYKSDTIIGRQVAYSENYLDHSANTATIVAPNYDTAVRVNVGITDSVNVTWTPIAGGFRYILQRRLASSIIWVTSDTVEASDPLVGTGVITGLSTSADYFVRMITETGQGQKISAEVSVPVL